MKPIAASATNAELLAEKEEEEESGAATAPRKQEGSLGSLLGLQQPWKLLSKKPEAETKIYPQEMAIAEEDDTKFVER